MRFLSEPDVDPAGGDDRLYEEALALGMQASDLVVRRRLALRMRLELEEQDAAAEPSEAELRAYHAAHPDEFREPARVRLEHVLLSSTPLPVAIPEPVSERTLAKLLGSELARATFSARPGAWVGPLRSPFGLHRIRVESRTPSRVLGLEAVRERVTQAVRAQRRTHGAEAALRELRGRDRVRSENPAP
jgi:hypothetical protein